ncbi:hypothetical protein [Dysgonomonas sp. 521]|nr:hypothetical protein [Dysgonomonas sp. 521]
MTKIGYGFILPLQGAILEGIYFTQGVAIGLDYVAPSGHSVENRLKA